MIATIIILAGHLDVHVADSEWFSRYHLTGATTFTPTVVQAPFSHRSIVSDDVIHKDGFQPRFRVELTSDMDGRTTVYDACEWRNQPGTRRNLAVDCLYDLGQVH